MEKELCLKFLVHLYNFSSTIQKKDHINEVDIIYINNEVDNFKKRINKTVVAEYDKMDALAKVDRIIVETNVDKAANAAKFILKAKFKWLSLLTGAKDDAHALRYSKVSEFMDKIKKVIAIIDYA